MPQYQMHPRIATTGRIRLIRLALGAACVLLMLLGRAAGLGAATQIQNESGGESHLLLLPLGETPIELLTHVVDVSVWVDGDGSLRMDVAASYRLHNPTRTRATLLMQADSPINDSPSDDSQKVPRLPTEISLESDGQLLALQPTGNGLQQTAQLDFAPDQQRTLLLRYSLRFVNTDLPAFAYPASGLDAWAGRVGSWRVSLHFAEADARLFAPDNWLAVEPVGWTFNGQRLQWLSEDPFPKQPLRWQVIHPRIWREILQRRDAIRQQPTVDALHGLGDIYHQLFQRTQAQPDIQAKDQERFYALALAAYGDALRLTQASAADPAESARLHQALAALYRNRSLQADGTVDSAYVGLMIDEAESALAGLPATAVRERSELAGWLADGLRLQARQAQQRRDWPTALALLDRLAALPSDVVDPISLAEERRLLLLEQSLQFLAQGNQAVALALAGSSLTTDDLLPGAERQTIFARWDFSLTIRPDDLTLTGTAPATLGREDEARQIVEQLALAWNAVHPSTGQATVQFDGKNAVISIAGLGLTERLALIQATPQNSHWVLLRTLLVNTDPEVASTARLIWQQTTLRHSVDLRPVADQWRGIGASLERDSLAAATGSSVEERIRGELFAITHRQEAERWQSLVRDSRVQIELAAGDRAATANRRVWSLQLTDSPQPLAYVSESVSLLRLFLAVVLAMALIFALAGILWLLL